MNNTSRAEDITSLLLQLGRLHQWYSSTYAHRAEQTAREWATLASQFVGTPNKIDRDQVERDSTLWQEMGLLRLIFVCHFFHAHHFSKQYPLSGYISSKKNRPTVAAINRDFYSGYFRVNNAGFPIFWNLTSQEASQGINDFNLHAYTASVYFKLEKTKEQVRDKLGKPHAVELHTLHFLFQADLAHHGHSSISVKKYLCPKIVFVGSNDPQIEKLAKQRLYGAYVVFIGKEDPIKSMLETLENIAQLRDQFKGDTLYLVNLEFLRIMAEKILDLQMREVRFDSLFRSEKRNFACRRMVGDSLYQVALNMFREEKGQTLSREDCAKLIDQGDSYAIKVSDSFQKILDVADNHLLKLAKREISKQCGEETSNRIAITEASSTLAMILKRMR